MIKPLKSLCIPNMVLAIMQSEVFRFIIIGLLATVTHFMLAVSLVELLLLPVLWANWAGFICASAVSYCGHYFWTFSSSAKHHVALLKFAVLGLLGFLLNGVLVSITVDIFLWPYVLGILLAVSLVPVMTFFVSKLWVYRRYREVREVDAAGPLSAD